MLTTISFGEVLIDMLSNKVGGNADSEQETFTKFAGGAPANVAVAVAKLGGDSRMAGKIGEDMFGDFLRDSLHEAGVNTDYLLSTREANTALAFVSLDDSGERSFTFYRNPSADMLFRADEFQTEWFANPGLFHFCSNTLTASDIAAATAAGAKMAADAGWLVSFDVNLRHNLWASGRADAELVWTLAADAHLVKMSIEEMDYLRGEQSEEQAIEQLFEGSAQLLLITDGGNPLRYFFKTASGLQQGQITPPAVKMVDSTAAGDAFVGGLMVQLAQQEISADQLLTFCSDTAKLEQALAYAARCGGYAAAHYGAFVALPTREQLESFHSV